MVDPTAAQWLAAATGVVAALIVLATVTGWGRRVPRVPVLLGLAAVGLGTGAGTTIMVLDGVVGLGVGWSWYHGVVGLVASALLVAVTRSYLRAPQAMRRPARRSPVAGTCIVLTGAENVAPHVQPMATTDGSAHEGAATCCAGTARRPRRTLR